MEFIYINLKRWAVYKEFRKTCLKRPLKIKTTNNLSGKPRSVGNRENLQYRKTALSF